MRDHVGAPAGRLRATLALTTCLVVAGTSIAGAQESGASRAAGAPTTTIAATSLPSTTGAAATTTQAGAATTTTATLPAPGSAATDPVRTLVPSIIAVPEVLTSEPDRQSAIAGVLTNGGNTIAVDAPPGTLCAVVPVQAPLNAAGRWERNGEPIATSAEQRRDPPGFGDCLANDDGEAVDAGVYQFIVIGPTQAVSAAATVVIGAPPVAVSLLNNGTEPVCLVLISPRQADFYEAFDAGSPLLPGEAQSLRVAQVEQEVRVYGCPPESARSTFQFDPEPQQLVELFEGDDASSTTIITTTPGATTTAGATAGAGASTTASATTVRPTTTT